METERSFGVFKPVGHVVVALPDAARADGLAQALAEQGLHGDAVRRLTDRQMLAQADQDLANASPVAALGQEINLVRAHRDLAAQGCHWLVVAAKDDEHAAALAQLALRWQAVRAQWYGRFVVEELIAPAQDLPQVAESPDRGLDAQSVTGEQVAAPARHA